MALTKLQKLAAQAIVQIFETGSVHGVYGQVTLIPGDTGHLTYGKAQTTLASGNLYFLIREYTETSQAAFAKKLRPFLDRLERKDTRLDRHKAFKRHLKAAGDDPVMQQVQDTFFDRVYWEPTLASADYIGAVTALGTAIIYDSRIHGSWHARRNEVIANQGALSEIGEDAWMRAYIAHRRNWLANHSNTILHATVYRMDALQQLIDQGNWDLALPFVVRGQAISEESLGTALPPEPSASAEESSPDRLLKLKSPRMRGDDVRELQLALIAAGHALTDDGIFGPGTDAAVRAFQAESGLTADGIVGGLTREALGLTA